MKAIRTIWTVLTLLVVLVAFLAIFAPAARSAVQPAIGLLADKAVVLRIGGHHYMIARADLPQAMAPIGKSGGKSGARQEQPQIAPVAMGRKHPVTDSMEVGASFDTTDCGAWGFQKNCQHWGTDYLGAQGTQVFAPFDLTVIASGFYGPGPTFGQWVQGTFPNGYVFYAGHLKDRPDFLIGRIVPAGTPLGKTNVYAHTHVQLAPPGVTGPCAQDGSCIDFQQYYATH